MRSFRTLNRYWQLLARYLRPQWSRMALLALVLGGTIAVQVFTPFVAGRFIDRAIAGGALRELVTLAIVTMGLALVAQGMAVAETYLAEQVSWSLGRRADRARRWRCRDARALLLALCDLGVGQWRADPGRAAGAAVY